MADLAKLFSFLLANTETILMVVRAATQCDWMSQSMCKSRVIISRHIGYYSISKDDLVILDRTNVAV